MKNIKNITYICTVFLFVLGFQIKTYAQTDWSKSENAKGGFTFAMPEKPDFQDTINVNFLGVLKEVLKKGYICVW
jgi:hypothetical protein